MLIPSSLPWKDGESLTKHLERRQVSRRQFFTFCGEMTAILGLSASIAPSVAHALQSIKRPSVIWLQLQECTGCVESVVRTSEPTIGDLVLDVVSLDYQHTLMAAAGHAGREDVAGRDGCRTEGDTSLSSPDQCRSRRTGLHDHRWAHGRSRFSAKQQPVQRQLSPSAHARTGGTSRRRGRIQRALWASATS